LKRETARAVWFTAPRTAELREHEVEDPGPGEILVRGITSLVSAGTEMNTYRGETAGPEIVDMPGVEGELPFPIKFAYQIVGRVEEAGPGAAHAVGETVFCYHPHQDLFTIATGVGGGDDIVSGASLVFPIPDGVGADQAAFGNLFCVAYNALLDVPIRIGDVAIVSGLGVIGNFAARLARLTAGRLILVDPLPERRARVASVGADAIVHMGKHGTLEWLPGKGIGLSGECYPDLLLGDTPLVYPFIINDPGEGSQSKRRAHAVIVDHLTPPMTTAETYGPLAELNQLVNEYYAVEKLDPVKLPYLQQQIWELVERTNLKTDLDLKTMLTRERGDHTHEWDDALTPEGIPTTLASMNGNEVAHLIEDLDGYLCELGMAQIRDGLHILGQMPPLPDMLRSLTRLANATAPSLQASLATAFGFDLAALLDKPGERLDEPRQLLNQACHTRADALEILDRVALDLYTMLETLGFRLEVIAEVQRAVLGLEYLDITAVLTFVCNDLVPKLEQSGGEIEHLLDALEGKYIPAGPAGAPTRGMAHILPSGRNFYAVDPRALPSQAAWRVGQQLAREAIERFRKEENEYPEMMGLSVWGTSQMRTLGDDIAEAFALLGVEPVWNAQSRRLEGVAIIPLEQLGRPRIDVTLRISGFFRDAFPHLIDMFDQAVSLVVELDEPLEQNFPRKHYLADLESHKELPAHEAEAQARYRIFGSKPGSYGAGILPLIETGNWQGDDDFARAFLAWGGYAYGKGADGVEAQPVFAERLKSIQVALHNQDNREHDIFDSDDYFQFHGGMVASIRALTGVQPKAYFGDSSRPDAVQVRDLREEALRVYRSRVVNPKWIESIKRHGYKGGLELAATVDYIFGFDATAQIAPDFVYEGLAEHYALSQSMREFLGASNPWALNAIAERLLEAAKRELWENPAPETLEALRGVLLESETLLEAQGEQRREAVL